MIGNDVSLIDVYWLNIDEALEGIAKSKMGGVRGIKMPRK
jgi:hypothetical protein